MKIKKMKIIYEDDMILIVDKPSGLLTVSNPYKDEDNLFHQASLYVKTKRKTNKVFIVNRLDKWTSGIVVFTKDYELKIRLQKCFEEHTVTRKYEAVCDGAFKKEKDTIKQNLIEDKFGNVFVTKGRGKVAITHYQVMKIADGKTLVDISLETGRKNQIRLAFQTIGHPVLGDSKYGKDAINKTHRLMLNCYLVEFPSDMGLKEHHFEIKRLFCI